MNRVMMLSVLVAGCLAAAPAKKKQTPIEEVRAAIADLRAEVAELRAEVEKLRRELRRAKKSSPSQERAEADDDERIEQAARAGRVVVGMSERQAESIIDGAELGAFGGSKSSRVEEFERDGRVVERRIWSLSGTSLGRVREVVAEDGVVVSVR